MKVFPGLGPGGGAAAEEEAVMVSGVGGTIPFLVRSSTVRACFCFCCPRQNKYVPPTAMTNNTEIPTPMPTPIAGSAPLGVGEKENGGSVSSVRVGRGVGP